MLEYACYVNKGQVHKTNDDAAMINHSIIHDGVFYGNSVLDEGLFAVADGVGSVNDSELASRYVLRQLSECSVKDTVQINEILSNLNNELVEFSERRECFNVLSTTLCLVSVIDTKLVSYNIGNSRLYRFRDGYLRQLTRDDSKVQDLIDMGSLSPDEAKEYYGRNIITKCLGVRDYSNGWIAERECNVIFSEGDILFLCTDGIHEYVDIAKLEEILSVDASVEEKVKVIVQFAEDAGGFDNETVLLIEKH